MFFLPHQPLPTFPLLRCRRRPISHPHLLLSSGYHIHISSSDLPSLSTPLTTPLLTNLVDPAFNPSSSFQMRPWQQEEEDGGESRPVIGQVPHKRILGIWGWADQEVGREMWVGRVDVGEVGEADVVASFAMT
ncbi:hypothetical protein ACFX13_001960 [Malus domestica]